MVGVSREGVEMRYLDNREERQQDEADYGRHREASR